MKSKAPDDYKFFPNTYLLPNQYNEVKKKFKRSPKTFIVKPEASCQGRGIYLIRKQEEIPTSGQYIIQRYIHRPYLLDGLKFDMRIYCLITGCEPLRIFIFKNGLARFATEPYSTPNKSNISNTCMHLTNYAINKSNRNFIVSDESDNKAHKRSLTSVFRES